MRRAGYGVSIPKTAETTTIQATEKRCIVFAFLSVIPEGNLLLHFLAVPAGLFSNRFSTCSGVEAPCFSRGKLDFSPAESGCSVRWVFSPGFTHTSAKAHHVQSRTSRSAEALLPPHKCGGFHPKTPHRPFFPQPVQAVRNWLKSSSALAAEGTVFALSSTSFRSLLSPGFTDARVPPDLTRSLRRMLDSTNLAGHCCGGPTYGSRRAQRPPSMSCALSVGAPVCP